MAYVDIELVKRGGNQAIEINKPTGADFHITSRGSDWLFAAFCIFVVIVLILSALSFKKPANERAFYYTTILPPTFMAVNYFTLASDLGWAPVKAEFNHVTTTKQTTHPGYRQVFYSRYIGWFLAWPFIIMNLGFLSRTPWPQIVFNVFFTEVYVIAFLVASVVHTTYKWGFYVIGIGAYIFVAIILFTTSRNLAKKVGKDVYVYYLTAASIVTFLWFIYPISFGISEGGNVIQSNGEAVFYGVLDVILFGFYPVLFLVAVSDFSLERLGLNIDSYEVVAEKAAAAAHAPRASGETAVSRSASGKISRSASGSVKP